MSNKLRISDDLSLPLDAITQTFAILAKRGVGKTHTGSVMAEEMLKVGQPIVVYDPTGAWWGLKSSADGKQAGYPVIIFGGEHADVPLEESAGTTIANVIVERRVPAILDCSLLRKGARIRFMTDFCETLYHKNREALHFFVDEAQTIAPQNLKAMPEAARLLGAMEDIVLQGRRRGLGMTIISPRPAVVNTNLRSACEVIIAMQIVAPHDRKAIQEWVDLHGDDASRAREMMDSLSSLKRGEAWVWSPSWLELFRRVTFRQRETFDSSATPKVGQKIVTPKVVAEIDLAALGEQIRATVRMAKAAAWSDLTGTDRPDKPWLSGLPRHIFISDMSDALSKAITFEYLKTEIIDNVTSAKGRRHIWMWLTKQAVRMAAFSNWLKAQGVAWPENLWPGTSVTRQATAIRAVHLMRVGDEHTTRFVSAEPLLELISLDEITTGPDDGSGWIYRHWNPLEGDNWCDCQDFIKPQGTGKISLVIVGGESGPGARRFDLNWAEKLHIQCRDAGVAFFMKQIGANAGWTDADGDWHRWTTKDRHGGDPDEWPQTFHWAREFPTPKVTA